MPGGEEGKETGSKRSSSSTIPMVTDEASTIIDVESIGDRVFELRNMTIRFPEGELMAVTALLLQARRHFLSVLKFPSSLSNIKPPLF